MKLSSSFSLTFVLALFGSANGQPTVKAVLDTALNLAMLLFKPATTGIEIISASTEGSSEQFGKFSKTTNVFPGLANTGIVLSSGDVTTVSVGNDDNGIDLDGIGDTDLESLLPNALTTDAAILEIAIKVPTAVTVTFSFVFASNEYPDDVTADVPDLFAFFLNGVNQAKINGSMVSVVTVHCGVDGLSTGPNCDQYVKNDDGNQYGTDIDGYTKTQTMTVLFPAGSHVVKLSVADADTKFGQNDDIKATRDAFVFMSFKAATVIPPIVPPKGMMMGMGMMGMR
jgi:hypothetical protein